MDFWQGFISKLQNEDGIVASRAKTGYQGFVCRKRQAMAESWSWNTNERGSSKQLDQQLPLSPSFHY